MSKEITLGEKLRNFRKRAGISQLELEMRIGAAGGMISRIESGETNPTKETLLKMISVLNLNPYDGASLFNIDIREGINKLTKLSSELNDQPDLNNILNTIMGKLMDMANVNTASIFLYDKTKECLEVKNIKCDSGLLSFVDKAVGIPAIRTIFYKNNPKHLNNPVLKSFLEDRIIEVSSIYDLAYPLLTRVAAKVISHWLNFKLALNFPIKFSNKKIGLLCIVWMNPIVSEGEYLFIGSIVDQIAIAIHNSQKYEELSKKYMELKNKYER